MNRPFMSVTRLTSQLLIGIPLCLQLTPVGSTARQLSTAAFRAARSAGRKAQYRQVVVPSAPTPVAVQGLCASVMAAAAAHMPSLLMTAITSQLERSPLKALASKNIRSMRVTAAVFHLEISALNSAAPRNSSFMSVTRLTSQSLIGIPLCLQLTPEESALRQLSTAAHSAARSGKAAPVGAPSPTISPPGTLHLPHFFFALEHTQFGEPGSAGVLTVAWHFLRRFFLPCTAAQKSVASAQEEPPQKHTPSFLHLRFLQPSQPAPHWAAAPPRRAAAASAASPAATAAAAAAA